MGPGQPHQADQRAGLASGGRQWGVYFLQSPKVTVKRALMGGFQLDIEGAKRTPRVRRVE